MKEFEIFLFQIFLRTNVLTILIEKLMTVFEPRNWPKTDAHLFIENLGDETVSLVTIYAERLNFGFR